MEVGEKGLIYLYCVAGKVPKLKEVENLVDSLYFVYHRGLYAIISKVKEREFSEENLKKNLADLEWIKAKASIHEKIIEGVMTKSSVIPFKFATLFNTMDNLKIMLDEHAEKLSTNLKNLADKEEWGVKIYCDIEKLKENFIREDKEILNIDKEINGSTTLTIDPERSRRANSVGPGKAYLLKKKKEELIKDKINNRINKYSQDSFQILKKLCVDVRINRLLPKEVSERKEDMILNSAFLVDKSNVAKFAKVINILKKQYEQQGLNFDCTGPWPPYNFCGLLKEKIHNG
ncbi:MAG: GvpL/GvpF family gas vesicle protein [Candidatus Omnitrophica bacterium]|nr:GvpL/GvpF family gas vesicle protein [Candidatus Omnitrophota bacterium]